MSKETIQAYDLPARVISYDADMELMHPNRGRMVDIAFEVAPFAEESEFTVLDLGTGTGFFTQAVLRRFPHCRVIAVDGAPSMIELAKARLGDQASRVDFRIGDFRGLRRIVPTRPRTMQPRGCHRPTCIGSIRSWPVRWRRARSTMTG